MEVKIEGERAGQKRHRHLAQGLGVNHAQGKRNLPVAVAVARGVEVRVDREEVHL